MRSSVRVLSWAPVHGRRYALVALVLIIATLVAQVSAMQAASAQTTRLADRKAGVYLGVWQPGAPYNLRALDSFERNVRKKVAIVHWYQGWGAANAALDVNALSAIAQRGSVPMITWEPWDYTKGVQQPEYRLANIAAGAFDPYIQSWASGLAAYQGTVLIRFAHEMNHPYYPWSVGVNGNTEADYVAAWRHVHDIFTAAGATNVEWVWSPLIWWQGAPLFEPMFPGDSYVDWVALDGYNNVAWGGWQSFSNLFGASYQRLTALSTKPIMIAEVASAEQGGNKAQWISDAYTNAIPKQFPRIRAVVWFNEKKEADWRVNSSSRSLRAFRQAISSTYYLSSAN